MTTTEPFTQLVIYTEPNTNANTDHVSAWMQQEVSKNNELPPLPFEMWSHIVSFTVQKKWNNLIIIGDYILMTYRSGAKLNGTGPSVTGPSVTGPCGIGAHMSSLNRFIKENKPNTINSIHQKTFGTTLADNRMQREIFSGRMTIQAALTMA
jgi:hypothetical protein